MSNNMTPPEAPVALTVTEFKALPPLKRAELVALAMKWRPWCSPAAPKGTVDPDCWRTHLPESPTWTVAGWNPTVEVEQAWIVLEWASNAILKPYEGQFTIARTAAGNPKARYEACITPEIYGPSGWAFGQDCKKRTFWQDETMPMAVCVCFLLAVGAIVPDPKKENGATSTDQDRT